MNWRKNYDKRYLYFRVRNVRRRKDNMWFNFAFLKHIYNLVVECTATITSGNFMRFIDKKVVDIAVILSIGRIIAFPTLFISAFSRGASLRLF